ncbi:methyl-accepting chemotaxis protein [Magnetococcales bacterium HHB-1]
MAKKPDHEALFASENAKILSHILDLEDTRTQQLKKSSKILGILAVVLFLGIFFLDIHPAVYLFDLSQKLKTYGLDEIPPVLLVCLILMIPVVIHREKAMKEKIGTIHQKVSDILINEKETIFNHVQEISKKNSALEEAIQERFDEEQILTNTIIQMGQQFHDLAEISGDLFCTLDHEGHFTFVSRTVQSLFGYNADELIKKPVTDFLGENRSWSEKDQEAVAKLMAGERVTEHPVEIHHKDGHAHRCLLSVVAVEDTYGNMTGFSASVILLTEKRQTERAIKERIHLICGNQNCDEGYLNTTTVLDSILQEQMREVIKVTEEAAYNLSSAAQTIDGQITQVMDYLTESNQWTQTHSLDSRKSIDADREAIEELRTFVADIETRKKEEMERGMTVVHEISGLGKLVNIVHEISERTNVLALNAGIIAARAGEHGGQFSTVALEVRKLSRQVREAAEKIGQGISHAVDTINTLFSQNIKSQSAIQEEDFLAQTAQKMMKMGENYATLLDRNESSMNQITEWNHELADRVMTLMSEIQFQDIARQRLEQIIKALDRRKEYSEKVQQALHDPDVDYHSLELLTIDDLRADYVMAGQHEIHAQATGETIEEEAESDAVPKIELF